MSTLRRRSLALAVAASTVFAGATVSPAVAQDDPSSSVESSIESGAGELPESSSEIESSAEGSSDGLVGSVADQCGDSDAQSLFTCALSITGGVTAALAIYGVLRTALYEAAGI